MSKIVVIGMPIALTFSRSTSIRYCGTPVVNVVETPLQLRPPAGGRDHVLGRRRQAVERAAGAVLQVELEAAGRAHSLDRRRVETDHDAVA